jgi:hypothetical protein
MPSVERRFRQWFTRHGDTDPTAAGLRIDGRFSFAPTFDARDFPGLLRCEVVRLSDSTTLILTVWRSSESMHLRLPDLADSIGATVDWTGLVADVRVPSGKWTASAGDVITKVAAIIGALTVMSSLFTSWFALPDVAIVVPDVQPINATIGVPIAFRVLVLNNSRTTPADSQLVASANGRNQVHLESTRVNLPPGGQATVSLRGDFVDPEEQTINVAARSRAGFLVPSRAATVSVRAYVWKVVSWKALQLQANRTTERVAFLRGDVAIGDPAITQVRCLATAINVPTSVQFRTAAPSLDGGVPRTSKGDRSRAISIEWTTSIRRPFEWVPITLSVDRDPSVEGKDWAASVIANAQWQCEVKSHAAPNN